MDLPSLANETLWFLKDEVFLMQKYEGMNYMLTFCQHIPKTVFDPTTVSRRQAKIALFLRLFRFRLVLAGVPGPSVCRYPNATSISLIKHLMFFRRSGGSKVEPWSDGISLRVLGEERRVIRDLHCSCYS